MLGSRLAAVAGHLLTIPAQLLLNGEGTNGGTSILDSSGNAFAITTSGVTTSTAQFKKGASSLAFGSSGYVYTPTSANLFMSAVADWTLDMYINPTAPPDGAYSCLAFSSNGGAGSWTSSHNNSVYLSSAGKLYLEYRNGTTVSNTPLATGDIGSAITFNVWTHVAVVYDAASTTMKTYLNGVLDSTNSVPNFGPTAAAPRLTVGHIDASGTTQVRPYGGFMDQVRLSQAKRWKANFTPD